MGSGGLGGAGQERQCGPGSRSWSLSGSLRSSLLQDADGIAAFGEMNRRVWCTHHPTPPPRPAR